MRRSSWVSLCALVLAACGSGDEETPAVADSGAVDSATVDSSSPDTSTPTDSETPDTATPDSMMTDSVVAETTADTTTTDTIAADITPDVVADTAVDSMVADTPSDAPAGVNCGTAPYLSFDPLSAANITGTNMSDVTVTGNICPATKVIVPLGGMKVMNVQKATPLFIIGTKTGSMTTFSPEYNINAAFPLAKAPLTVGMFATDAPTTLADPAWSAATKAFFYFTITSSTGSGACSMKDGVTVSVTGHSEAVLKYGGGGTSTGAGGSSHGWGTIVTTGTEASPEYATLVATKAGCKVTLGGSVGSFVLSGRMPFARGAATVGIGYEITN
jgi:hypothetical protein